MSVEIDFSTDKSRQKLGNILTLFGCKSLQLIFVNKFEIEKVENLLNDLNNSRLNSIEIVAQYDSSIEFKKLIELQNRYQRLDNIILYQGYENSILHSEGHLKNIIMTSKGLEYQQFISAEHFTLNPTFFSEAQHYNTFFNRRLFIDSKGKIKNSQNNSNNFGIYEGDIKKLKEVVASDTFQKIWFSSKIKTDICKDCEFRFMCFDNRIPLQRSDKTWYHTTECSYNPYIAKWTGEEDYKTLSECGIYSDAEGFRMDEEKVGQINTELWGED